MMRRVVFMIMVLILAAGCNLGAGGGGIGSGCSDVNENTVTTATELKYENLRVCGGSTVQSGQTVVVNYISYIKDGNNLKPLKNTYDAQKPISFKVGGGQVVKGLEQGVIGMHIGDKRRLTLTPNLHYGTTGNSSEGVPQNVILVYDVEVTDIGH